MFLIKYIVICKHKLKKIIILGTTKIHSVHIQLVQSNFNKC